MPSNSSQIYQEYTNLKNSPVWDRLDPIVRDEYERNVQKSMGRLLEGEGEAPIITPYDKKPETPPAFVEPTAGNAIKEVGKSFLRIPHAAVETGLDALSGTAGLVGAPDFAAAVDQANAAVDADKRNVFGSGIDISNQIRPPTGKEYAEAFGGLKKMGGDVLGGHLPDLGDLYGSANVVARLAPGVPEFIGPAEAIGLLGKVMGRVAESFGGIPKAMEAAKALEVAAKGFGMAGEEAKATEAMAKAAEIVNGVNATREKIQNLGLGHNNKIVFGGICNIMIML